MTAAGRPLPDAPADISGVRLFTVGGVEFTVADVVPMARAGNPEPVAADGPAAAQEAFRRARGLLTADQLNRWLAVWAITPEEFVSWTVTPSATDSWAALVCSGALDRAASEIATAAAAACELGAAPTAAAWFDPTGWADRLAARAGTDEAVRDTIAAHRLDWTVVEGTGVLTADRAAAEELRHWVVDDGLDLAIAAAQAGRTTYPVSDVLATIGSAQLRAVLAGALPGELVGPVRDGTGWTVLVVNDRTEPSSDDPAVVARARAVLRSEILERAVVRHVTA